MGQWRKCEFHFQGAKVVQGVFRGTGGRILKSVREVWEERGVIVRLASVGSREGDGIRFDRPEGGQDSPL